MTEQTSKTEQTVEKTVPLSDFEKQKTRAENFESKFVDLEKTLERYSKLGAVEDLQGKLEDYGLLKDKSAGIDPEVRKQLEVEVRTAIQKDLEAKDIAIQKLSGEIKELKVVDKVFGRSTGKLLPNTDQYLKSAIRNSCGLNEAGQIIVSDTEGKVRYKKDKPSELMDENDFILEFLETNPFFAKSNAKGGDGAERNDEGNTNSVTAERFANMSPEERRNIPLLQRDKLWNEAHKKGLVR